MHASIDIPVRARITSAESDGRPCAICGDPIYMSASAVRVEIKACEKWTPCESEPSMHLCQSCADGRAS